MQNLPDTAQKTDLVDLAICQHVGLAHCHYSQTPLTFTVFELSEIAGAECTPRHAPGPENAERLFCK